jgi:hypothetical protein
MSERVWFAAKRKGLPAQHEKFRLQRKDKNNPKAGQGVKNLFTVV